MLGLDDKIASLGTGEAFVLVALVAVVLGLRHATDPDHLTAVTTLIAGDDRRERGSARALGLVWGLGLRHATDPDHLTAVTTLIAGDDRRERGSARALGLIWGLGHATTLFAFGLPIVLSKSYLPERVQQAAELAVGILIIALAVRLLTGRRSAQGRTPLQAFGIGLLHGIGGSAAVGVLLLAAIPGRVEAIAALALFAAFTAISMALASSLFGYALTRPPVLRRFATAAPALGALSLTFGVWYSLGATGALPYVF